MANWLYKINIKNFYDEDSEEKLLELCQTIVNELKRIREPMSKVHPQYLDYLDECISDFTEAIEIGIDDVDEFDYLLSRLYDFGDIVYSPTWPLTRLCWIGKGE